MRAQKLSKELVGGMKMRTRPEMDWVDITFKILTEGKPNDRDMYELMVSEGTVRNIEDHFNVLNLDLIKKQELWKSKLPYIYESGVITKDDVSETYSLMRKYYQLEADSDVTRGEEFLRSLSLTLFQRISGVERRVISKLVNSIAFLNWSTCYTLLLKHPSMFRYDDVYIGLLAFNETNEVNWNIDLYRKHINYYLENYRGLIKYIDVDMLENIDKQLSELTVKEAICLGITHDVIRNFKHEIFEGLTRNEFNEFIHDLENESFYTLRCSIIVRSRLVDFLRKKEINFGSSSGLLGGVWSVINFKTFKELVGWNFIMC